MGVCIRRGLRLSDVDLIILELLVEVIDHFAAEEETEDEKGRGEFCFGS